MTRWNTVFYPPEGYRLSPLDALFSLCNHEEKALIMERLGVLREVETWEWPSWVKKVTGVYQVRSGDFRVYFDLDEDNIVVTHICRKTSQKTKMKDISIAKENFQKYKT